MIPAAPTKKKAPRVRDLSRGITLRAADIFALYGIPSSTLCGLAHHPDPARRPPSRLIPGRSGRKGIRLFPRAEFEAWLARWSSDGEYKPAA